MNIRHILFTFILLTFSVILKGQISYEAKFRLDSIIPIYQFSKSSTGLTLVIWEYNSNEKIEQFINRVKESENLWSLYMDRSYDDEKVKIVDSTSIYKLFYNKTIFDSLSYLIGKSFYIYGDKGICKSKICDILIHFNECRTNFILLKLDKIDKKIGHPIFAMKDKVVIEFKRDINLENAYNEYLSSIPKDYTNKIPSRNFAKWGDLYLFYSDTFDWYNGSNDCRFPFRRIITNTNDNYKIIWNQGLDLYGIPCD